MRDVARLDSFVEAVLIGRLSRPDALADLVAEPEDTLPLQAEAAQLRARMDEVASEWAVGTLTRAQLVSASQAARTRLDEVERSIAERSRGSVLNGLIEVDDVAARWRALNLDRRRAVLDAFMTVTVMPRQAKGRLPGGGYFDPKAVRIDWRI